MYEDNLRIKLDYLTELRMLNESGYNCNTEIKRVTDSLDKELGLYKERIPNA